MRSHSGVAGTSGTSLYNTGVTLKAGVMKGMDLDLYGAQKSGNLFTHPLSGGFLIQRGALTHEWGAHRVQLGIVRVPFGIYDYRETYGSGLIDYPMARGDYHHMGVDWGAPGVQYTGGSSNLRLDLAAFDGNGVGLWNNTTHVNGVSARIQAYRGNMILGASRWDGSVVQAGARGGVHLSGVDVRYSRSHLVVRGEYLVGMMGGQSMHGWYLDTLYRLPKFEKFSLVGRLEMMSPSQSLSTGQQLTLGVRYTLARNWAMAANWRRNNASTMYTPSWTPYAGKSGDVYLQLFHEIKL